MGSQRGVPAEMAESESESDEEFLNPGLRTQLYQELKLKFERQFVHVLDREEKFYARENHQRLHLPLAGLFEDSATLEDQDKVPCRQD